MRILLLFIFIKLSILKEAQKLKNPCIAKRHCGECIVSHPQCAWCMQEDYIVDNKPRCDYSYNLIEKGCQQTNLINPENNVKITMNKPLSLPGTLSNFVQIAPQGVNLKLRPGKPQSFQIKFRQAEDYPIDLYYLMDLSNSMEDDKEKLALLGDLLSVSMKQITTNFRVGFGSFVDKVVMPYVSIVPEKLKQPCDRCAAPYSFKNHLSLTNDTHRFADEIKTAPVSGNLDAPEGGLDAIMQAIVCRDQIGWRPQARNLLIFSTDASFHFAGDGKLGGIVTPNDGQCHLDSNGYYTHGTIQDYPSVSQIIQKVREKSVNIIFAITGEQLPIYKKFSQILKGSTVGQLANDSSNIVELVKHNYNEITSKVEIKDSALANMTVTYESSCLGGKKKKTKMCDGIKVGDTVTFDVTVTLDSCPINNVDPQELKINAIGIGEQLTIKIESQCDCKCAKPPYAQYNSPKCSNGHGTYECGTCRCHENRFGRNCECDSSATHLLTSPTNLYSPATGQASSTGVVTTGFTMNDLCIKGKKYRIGAAYNNLSSVSDQIANGEYGPNYLDFAANNKINVDPNNEEYDEYYDVNGPICSGRGDCVCGICECWPRENPNEIVTGEFCECDNFSCDRHENKICGGRGTCECGSCDCRDGWVGDACQCPSTNASCIASNGKICNGVGICDCGVCICDVLDPTILQNNPTAGNIPSGSPLSDSIGNSNRYRGPTCEECPTCLGLCSENRACVQCLVFKSGPLHSQDSGVDSLSTNEMNRIGASGGGNIGTGSGRPTNVLSERTSSPSCERQCSHLNPIVVDDLIGKDSGMLNDTLCQFKDDDDCTFYFTYHYDPNRNLVITVQKNKACVKKPNILAIVLPIVIGIIILGLVFLMIWKLLTIIHDKREYAKFQKHLSSAKWDTGENPIFKQATSTYKNPMFRKNR